MTILSMVENVTQELGLPVPAAVVGSSDNQVKQMLKVAERVGDQAVSRYQWPQLIKRHTFTLTASDETYALPADFDRFIGTTGWDQTNQFPLIGPIQPQEFEWRTYGIGGTTPRVRFTVRGNGLQRLYLYPTPESADTYSYLYISKNWILPVEWTASTAFTANSYCSYDGNIYLTSAGGTTGSTEPTHTSGSSSDGGVTWTYQDIEYTTFQADTDYSLIDEKTLEIGIEAEWAFRNGLQYEAYAVAYETMLRRNAHALNGGKTLNISKQQGPYLLSYLNVPDSGYGS